MSRASVPALALAAVLAAASPARPTAVQLNSGNTALIFGGSDAEGGIGDWYVSNGVVEAVIDDASVATDLSSLLPGAEPPIQSEASPTGGTVVDVGRVGENNDQLSQMFTVGGLSTSNFILYDTVSAPSSDTIRATGKLLFPPLSPPSAPCIDIVTDHTATGSDSFLTITTTATNNCASALFGFGGFLDAFVWTLRSTIPFSAGGRGFNHANLDLSNPAPSLEIPTFLGGPGVVTPADGIMDPANGTVSGEASYGLLGVDVTLDADGPGGSPPTTTPVNVFFGVSSNLASALGNFPVAAPGGLAVGGTLTYRRRIYVGSRNDVRSTGDAMIAELAARTGFSTGTISGDVDAADAADVAAAILITRLGRCSGNASLTCKVNAPDCTGAGTCVDPVPTPNFPAGNAVSQVRTDATGAFSGVVLPAGTYELEVSSSERTTETVKPVVVTAGNDTPVTIPALSARGTLAFTVRDKRTGALVPAKLVLKGLGAGQSTNPTSTDDPRWHKDMSALLGTADLMPETFGGSQAGSSGSAAAQGNVVYTATGQGSIEVSPGRYDVYVVRGVEYSLAYARLRIDPAATTTQDFLVKRVVKTKDAVSADFHVHSGRSFDSSAPLRDRVMAFAAEGVEVMVSTDHDKHVDYTPIITSLGLNPLLRSIVGNEVTGSVPNPPNFPQSFGHINAWPQTVAPGERRDGAIQDEYVAPNWLYKRLRDGGAEVIQYNHPRAGVSGLTSIGFFNNIGCNRCANDIDMPCVVDTDCPASPAPRDCTCVGYQPDRPVTMAPNDVLLDTGVVGPGSPANPDLDPDTGAAIRNLDFDVMEIMNGAKDGDLPAYEQVRRDWLSLLNQGIVRPGTGVSDSHRVTVEHAGWARSFVLGVGDDPALLDVPTFNAQVRAGSMVMSAGPYIEFYVKAPGKKAGIGQTLVNPAGAMVTLHIKVSSPAWIPIDEVRVFQNGFIVATYNGTTNPKVRPVPADFTRTGGTRRFRGRIPVTLAQDTYFVVEARALATPAVVDVVESDVVPLALTNPIFVDLAGGGFDPPGLPVMARNTVPPATLYAAGEHPGLWRRAWGAVAGLASRFTSEVVAEENPGTMTGVTREQKEEAVRKGEYFPLHEFKIPPEAVEQLRRQKEAQEAPAAPGSGAPAR